MASVAALLAVALAGSLQPGAVHRLTPATWHTRVPGETWFIKFYVQGCKHCERLAPMWEALAQHLHKSGSTVLVGEVDCTAHNGIGRTFGVERFPELLLIDSSGSVHTFSGRRGLPLMLQFAGGYKLEPVRMQLPATLLDNVPEWWLVRPARASTAPTCATRASKP